MRLIPYPQDRFVEDSSLKECPRNNLLQQGGPREGQMAKHMSSNRLPIARQAHRLWDAHYPAALSLRAEAGAHYG